MSKQFPMPQRDSDGSFPAYAWPGGYPIIYVDRDGDVLCADCTTKHIDRLCDECNGEMRTYKVGHSYDNDECVFCDGLSPYGDPKESCPACLSTGKYVAYSPCESCNGSGKANSPNERDYPIAADIYYEGPTLQCADCNRDIESAYGDPEESAADVNNHPSDLIGG